MKKVFYWLTFLIVVFHFQFSTPLHVRKTWGSTYYIATDGNDGTGDGSIGNPWATTEHLVGNISAGDKVYLRGGTYRSGNSLGYYARFEIYNLSGTYTDHISIENYPGETVIYNCDDQVPTGDGFGMVIVNCDYLDVSGIRITGLDQNGSNNALSGLSIQNSDNITLNWCTVDNIQGTGFTQIYADSIYYNYCDAHSNGDVENDYEGSNGFDATATVNTSNYIKYYKCRAWWNSDDGWDFFNLAGEVYLEDCDAFWNGYLPGTFTHAGTGDGNGFKLGPGNGNTTTIIRYLDNCRAFENYQNGFDENYNSSNKYPAQLRNCTSYGNDYGYLFLNSDRTHIFINNVSYNNTSSQYLINAESTQTTNSWQSFTVDGSDFVNLNSSKEGGARNNKTHEKPKTMFLKLQTGSDLIDGGTSTGKPFHGSAIDLGADESPVQYWPSNRRN